MQENHLLEYIEIKDFKCFKDFKAEGFKRVNLIGGMNNVGKTAFMEACFVNIPSISVPIFLHQVSDVSAKRDTLSLLENSLNNKKIINIDFLKNYIKSSLEKNNKIRINSSLNNIYFEIHEKNGVINYEFNLGNENSIVNFNDFSFQNLKSNEQVKFIDNFGLSNGNIIKYYSSIQKKNKEDYLNYLLSRFDERIEFFKIIDELPQCKIKGYDKNDGYLKVTELGDGVRHLISIVASLYACEKGYLFIDEIDNGIHYTQLDRLWEIILTISNEQNVQVFATTHSKECIESYARVSKKLEDKDTTFIKMSRLKDGSINAGIRDYEMLQYSIDDEHEVR